MLCSSSGNHRDPHSFPTRRSSDLIRLMIGAQVKDFRDRGVTIGEMEKEFKCCYVPITGGGVAAHIAGKTLQTAKNLGTLPANEEVVFADSVGGDQPAGFFTFNVTP